MRKYRLVLLIKSDLKKDQVDKLLTDVKKWFGDVKEDTVTEMGEKKLAYTIKHEKKANYMVVEFSAETINTEAEKRIQIQDSIIRHLLVRVD